MDDAVDSTERLVDRTVVQPVLPETFTRYDAIIALIPLLYLFGLTLSFIGVASFQVLLVTSSLIAIAVIANALFGNPPTPVAMQPESAETSDSECT